MTSAAFTLEGKVAAVTGGAVGGIGEAYARGLAEADASLVCADLPSGPDCQSVVTRKRAWAPLGLVTREELTWTSAT